MPHVRHEATENVSIGKLTDVDLVTEAGAESDVLQLKSGLWVPKALSELGLTLSDNDDVVVTSAADGDVLTYDSGTSDFVNVPPWRTDRRQTSLVGLQVQAGPVGQWIPLAYTLTLGDGHYTDDTGWTNLVGKPSTNIIGSWTPVALPTGFIDVDDASGFSTGDDNMYVTITIPGGAVTVVRYTSISIGGGAGGSDRITLQAAGGGLGNGHRGIGTPAAGALVKESTVELYAPDSADGDEIAQVLLGLGSLEAISGGVVGWRLRSANSVALYTPGNGVLNLSTNTAEETAQIAGLFKLTAKDVGWLVEFFSDTAGGTASQVRTDPLGFLGPAISWSDYGEVLV